MPIYEFHCRKCEKDSEILVRSRNWRGTKCPHCGSTRLAKKLSVFASTGATAEGCDSAPACGGEASGACGGCCGRRGKHRH